MANEEIILITGARSGFGHALAQEALAQGYTVAGTVRGDEARSAVENLHANAKARWLDVTDFAEAECIA